MEDYTKMKGLHHTLHICKYYYYEFGVSIVSDSTFDGLEKEYISLCDFFGIDECLRVSNMVGFNEYLKEI